MECEITPTMLWMSSSKRYIWYFTLHCGNLRSKQMPPVEGKYNNRKEIGERRNPWEERNPTVVNLVRFGRRYNACF